MPVCFPGDCQKTKPLKSAANKLQSELAFKAIEFAVAKNSQLQRLFKELGINKVKITLDFKKNLNHIVLVNYQFLNLKSEPIFQKTLERNFKALSLNNIFDNIEEIILEHQARIV